MGLAMALLILTGALSAWRGTRRAPIGAVAAGVGSLREQLRIVAQARNFRLLLTTFVVQALATGAMLAGVAYVAKDLLRSDAAATFLFVCAIVWTSFKLTGMVKHVPEPYQSWVRENLRL